MWKEPPIRPQRVILAGAILIAALAASRGEAALIPWSYEWNARPIVVDADAPPGRPAAGITLIPGAITITGGPHGVAWGSSQIVAVNLATFSFSPSGSSYRFSDAPYQLSARLTDIDSHTSRSLSFSGVFNGTMTDSRVDLRTRFLSPVRQSVVLGHHRYTVTLASYAPPGPPAIGSQGKISAYVEVRPATAPEPSSLLLAATGLAATLFFARWRKAVVPLAMTASIER
jgi:hypothetical protein